MSAQSSIPDISYLVPVHNAEHLIADQLAALVADRTLLPVTAEILIIDDASSDATAGVAERWFAEHAADDAEVLVRPVRGGPNASRNTGLRRARGGFVIFVDGDDIIIPGAGAELWRHRSAWSVLGGRVEVAGMPRPLETSPWSLPRWCGWRFSHGGLMAGDRATFIDCGGFDENILLGGTETEFAIRAQSQFGVGFVAVPGARLTYRTPISARGRFGKNFRRERGYAYTQRRHRAVVVDDGWRVGLSQIARGVLSVMRRRPQVAGPTGFALIGAGAGRVTGRLVWRSAERVHRRQPLLLEVADHGEDLNSRRRSLSSPGDRGPSSRARGA